MAGYRTCFSVALLTLLPACAGAQFPSTSDVEFRVSGPKQVQVGRPIILHVELANSADPKPDVDVEFRAWKQSDPDAEISFHPDDCGETVSVYADPGQYEIEVTVTLVSNARIKVRKIHDLFVDGQRLPPIGPVKPKPIQPVDPIQPDPIEPKPEPVKPVDPPPSPKPQPVDPVPAPIQPPAAGEFGLAPKVFDLASKAGSATRAADCQMLAGECKRIAASDWANLNGIATEIVSVLKKLPTGWEELSKAVQSTIAELYQSGRIKNVGDVKRLLTEVAAAFDLAGKVK